MNKTIQWPEKPQCSACKTKPCGTYHPGPNADWLSLCCNASLLMAKKPAKLIA